MKIENSSCIYYTIVIAGKVNDANIHDIVDDTHTTATDTQADITSPEGWSIRCL